MKKPAALVAKSPADLLAAVPCVLGFEPEESLVMLTFGGRRQAVHARVDLPTTPDQVHEAVESLLWAALANDVRGVVIAAYTDDRGAACRAVDALAFALTAKGVSVAELLLVRGDRFWTLWPDQRDTAPPQRLDTRSHRFRAETVLRGRVVHPSRAALAATVAADPSPALVEAVARESTRDRPRHEQISWLEAALPRMASATAPPPPDEAARILVALRDMELLEVVVRVVGSKEPDDWLDLWTQLVRSAPLSDSGGPAALLAFVAWRAGQGALAWCGVDRCREADPGNAVAEMVAGLLEHAVPPSVWA